MTSIIAWAVGLIGWPIVAVVFLAVIVLLCCGLEYREDGPDGRKRHLRVRRVTDRR